MPGIPGEASRTAAVFSTARRPFLTFLILLLLTGHSFLMNGYYSSHRYLTVATYFSSIRNQLDPELFRNSIYIQAVNRVNLRIGLFYDALPFIAKHIDLETFALLHSLASLFCMLAGLYALGITLTRSRAAAILATLLYTVQLNNWTLGSPAPYLNFFHHGLPYTYPLIVWSMLFFLRGRHVIALLLTGISFNFHPMCTLFLLCAYALFWAVNRKTFTSRYTLVCIIAFMLPALPGISKTISHMGAGGSGELWLEGVRWVAGYTCYPSTWAPSQFMNAALFLAAAGASLLAFPKHSIRRTVLIFWTAVALMCLAGTIFADIIPIPFIIKLSLWRSTVIYLFLAIIFIAWACLRVGSKSPLHALLAISIVLVLTGYVPHLPQFCLAILLPVFIYALYAAYPPCIRHTRISTLTIAALAALCIAAWLSHPVSSAWLIAFLCLTLPTAATARYLQARRIPALAVWGLTLLLFDAAVLTYQGGPNIYFHGYLQGKRDPWADIQIAARKVSGRDDLFIVPPLCNDFYHYSLRAVLGDWAEGSTLLYLDNRYTEEWFERMHDLGWTSMHNAEKGFNRLTTAEITKTAEKYGAAFVVTKKPKTFGLPKVYENTQYILYRIRGISTQ